jgi:hypothetical protein
MRSRGSVLRKSLSESNDTSRKWYALFPISGFQSQPPSASYATLPIDSVPTLGSQSDKLAALGNQRNKSAPHPPHRKE